MESSKGGELTVSALAEFEIEFFSNNQNVLSQNVSSKTNPFEASISRRNVQQRNHVYTHKVDEEVKPLTNQKESGRCWLFACLNAMRIPFMKAKEIEEFEFSQAYLFFWDKIERANYFLNTIVKLYRREPKETQDGRLVNFLLKDPINDAGQWDMVVNIIQKHGVMPKSCFPESFSCEDSIHMNSILRTKLREYAHDLHENLASGMTDDEIQDLIKTQMKTIYRIVGICLGIPLKEFIWEYTDKSKKYNKVGPISPLDFYKLHVQQHFDVSSKVCLVSDPRPQNPPGKLYTVDCLGNVVGGRQVIYNNQPIEVLMEVTAKSIKEGEPVWFGSEAHKFMAGKEGLLDVDALRLDLIFGTDVFLWRSKAERISYEDSQMNHAMVITAIHETDGEVSKWRIENSYGSEVHDKGYLMMTTDWFKEFVFEVVVDKKMCSEEILKVFQNQDPIVLPAWDPMGALA